MIKRVNVDSSLSSDKLRQAILVLDELSSKSPQELEENFLYAIVNMENSYQCLHTTLNKYLQKKNKLTI